MKHKIIIMVDVMETVLIVHHTMDIVMDVGIMVMIILMGANLVEIKVAEESNKRAFIHKKYRVMNAFEI